jgi:hypothetical protein
LSANDSIFDFGFSQFGEGLIAEATFTNTICMWLPRVFADNRGTIMDCIFSYGYTGMMLGENATLIDCSIFECPNAYNFWTAGGNLMKIIGGVVAGATNVFYLPAGGCFAPDLYANINVQNNPASGVTNPVFIYNPDCYMHGDITIHNSSPAGTYQTNTLHCVGDGVANSWVMMYPQNSGGVLPPIIYSDTAMAGALAVSGAVTITGQTSENPSAGQPHIFKGTVGSGPVKLQFDSYAFTSYGMLELSGYNTPTFPNGTATTEGAFAWHTSQMDAAAGLGGYLGFAALNDGSFNVWSNVTIVGNGHFTGNGSGLTGVNLASGSSVTNLNEVGEFTSTNSGTRATFNGTNGAAVINSLGNFKTAPAGTPTEVNFGTMGNKTNGLYMPTANETSIANNGTNALQVTNGAVNIPGTLTAGSLGSTPLAAANLTGALSGNVILPNPAPTTVTSNVVDFALTSFQRNFTTNQSFAFTVLNVSSAGYPVVYYLTNSAATNIVPSAPDGFNSSGVPIVTNGGISAVKFTVDSLIFSNMWTTPIR